MSLNVVAWVSVTLFLVHKFEEIVFIKPWLRRRRNDPRARRTAFWSFADTTTSTIAALIFEEYVLFVIIAFISVSMGNAALHRNRRATDVLPRAAPPAAEGHCQRQGWRSFGGR